MKAKYVWGMSAMMLLFAGFVSCSEETEDGGKKQTNYVSLTGNGSLTITEDQQDTIKVNMLLAQTVKANTTLEFVLQNNDDAVVKFVNPTITLNPGEKTAVLKFVSNNKSLLEEVRPMTLVLQSSTDENIKLLNTSSPIVLTINPDAELQVLTEEQKQLLASYKENMGIDVARFLGRLECKVKVTFPSDEIGTFFDDNEVREFQGKSVLALSEASTAEKPVLKMTSNPLGLTDFLYEIMRKETVESEYWMASPYAQPILDKVQYEASKETFDVTLDNLVLNADKTVNFLGEALDSYGDPVTVVPFAYNYSAWNRMKQQAEAGDKIQVEEGGTTVEYTLAEAIEMGSSLNPESFLVYSSLHEDKWENEPSDWVNPQAQFDEAAGTLTFTFPWDHANSSGYTKIEVVYTLKNNK